MIDANVLQRLGETLAARKAADPASSYVAGLLARGEDAILRKVAEESAETLLASKEGDKLHLVREVADLWFHSMVLLAWHGLTPNDVLAELHRREGISGIAEKKSRKPQA
jgi:phosphoribosyl-ATP pyrophosphohydrolase